MPKMHVEKSIEIQASEEKVFNTLNDFNHWSIWSPWLIQEPEARVKVAEDNKSYEWEGDRIGSGNMSITAEDPCTSINYDLNFLKPWKSKAKVRFEIKPNGSGATATWIMDSSLPFFLFWMKKMMVAFVGMDFQRGLNMLKDYVEDGKVHSRLEFKGNSVFDGCSYVGIQSDCSMDDIGSEMQNDFSKLWAYTDGKEESINGCPFSMYHKWDMVGRKVSYTCGIPVKEIPKDLPNGIISGNIPTTKTYTLKHTGPYLHLGNAWSTLHNMGRSKFFKVNKKVHPFETYANKVGEVPDHDLIAEVHFPIK